MAKSPGLVGELAALPLFRSLDPSQLERIAGGSRRQELKRGAFLFHRGDRCHGCYGVASGLIQLSLGSPEGFEKVVEIIGHGETFGEAVMFLDRPYPVDAIALLPTELIQISSTVIDDLLADDPSFSRSMLASMASRLHTMVNDIEMYTLRSAVQRVVAFLIGELGARVASRTEERVVLRSTKQVLASRLGLSSETFSRVMRDLVERDLVRVEGRRIVIFDPRALTAFVS